MHIDLPRGREFITEINSQGSISVALDEFSNDRARWSDLIPNGWLEKIPFLRKLFEGLISDQKREEEENIIESVLSSTGIEEFRSGFFDRFVETAAMRNIFKMFGAIQDETKLQFQSPGTKRWGVNALNDKAAYTQYSGRPYRDWGENYGWQLAASESLTAMDTILGKLQPCNCSDAHGIVEKLAASFRSLREAGSTPSLILASLNPNQRMELHKSPQFEDAWLINESECKQIPNFEGFFIVDGKTIPLFGCRATMEGVACIMDLTKCLKWIQRSPDLKESDRDYTHNFFYFRVADLSKEDGLRASILKDNPSWLAHYQDKDRYLRQHVWLQIFERFDIELLEARCGCRLTFE
jgi:hypothetical protein